MEPTPRISREENERIARREKMVSRLLIVAICAVVLGLLAWGIATDASGAAEGDVGPDPADVPCQVSYCP